ncbi:MAG: hypothetical protein ACREK5_07045 [Gemmatimonadota bacterium]
METFVVRVWRSAATDVVLPPDHSLTLRGLVEHVGSGRSKAFQNGEELLSALTTPETAHGKGNDQARRRGDS